MAFVWCDGPKTGTFALEFDNVRLQVTQCASKRQLTL